MKNIIIFLVSSMLIFSCNSGNNSSTKSGFETFKTIHEKDKGTLTFSMPAFIFKAFVNSDKKDVKDAVNEINNINFLIQEKANDAFTSDLKKFIFNNQYKSLMKFNEKDAEINVVANGKEDKFNEVVIVINDKTKNSSVLLKIGGNFDAKSVKNLAEGIDIEGVSKYR